MKISANPAGGASVEQTPIGVEASNVETGRFISRASAADGLSTSELITRSIIKQLNDVVDATDATSLLANSGASLSDAAGTSEVISVGLSMAKSDAVTTGESGSAHLDSYSIDYSLGYAGTTAAW